MKKRVIGLVSVITCFYVGMKCYALEPSSEEIYNGIDVSEWQGEIDFEAVKQSGIEVVYIKSSESRWVDPYFESNYEKATAANLKVGVYHYVTARTVEEARLEAAFFVSVLEDKAIDCRLVMDFESFGDLSVAEINEIGLVFLQTVESLSGKEVVVYSDTSDAINVWDESIANYPLWVAEYGVSEPQNNGKWSSWVGFQYSDAGSVSGIGGSSVDLDYFTEGIFLSDQQTPVPSVPDEQKPTPNEPTTSDVTYTVRSGDTLSEIAMRFGVSVSDLVSWNNIGNPNLIYPGEVLKVRVNSAGSTGITKRTYTVQSGDTLSEIALRFGVSVSNLVSWNNISNPDLIYPGEVLRIRGGANQSTSEVAQTYTVRSGDTLSEIAVRFGVSVSDLVSWNNISNPDLIYPGEVLRIRGGANQSTSEVAQTYTVRSGDTLSEIAVRFGVSVSDLVSWNNISNPNLIYLGEVLQVN